MVMLICSSLPINAMADHELGRSEGFATTNDTEYEYGAEWSMVDPVLPSTMSSLSAETQSLWSPDIDGDSCLGQPSPNEIYAKYVSVSKLI